MYFFLGTRPNVFLFRNSPPKGEWNHSERKGTNNHSFDNHRHGNYPSLGGRGTLTRNRWQCSVFTRGFIAQLKKAATIQLSYFDSILLDISAFFYRLPQQFSFFLCTFVWVSLAPLLPSPPPLYEKIFSSICITNIMTASVLFLSLFLSSGQIKAPAEPQREP